MQRCSITRDTKYGLCRSDCCWSIRYRACFKFTVEIVSEDRMHARTLTVCLDQNE